MSLSEFYSGLRKGFPIALGYLPIAIAFGLLAKIVGLSIQSSILMSAVVFAGASQFIALNLLLAETNHWQIIFTVLIINLRHFLMSAFISQRINKKSRKLLPLLAFGITDETFSLISLNLHTNNNLSFVLGINLSAYIGWVAGTVIGVAVGKGLPVIVQTSMGIALYVMFIGLLIPGIKKSKEKLAVSLIAVGINSYLYWGPALISSLNKGWKIMITVVITCTLGSLIFKGVTNNE